MSPTLLAEGVFLEEDYRGKVRVCVEEKFALTAPDPWDSC